MRDQVLGDLSRLSNASLHIWYERDTRSSLPIAGVHAGDGQDEVDLPEGAAYYLCGPLPFMRSVRSALIDRDVPARDIEYEVFGPDLWQAELDTEPTPGATADRVAPPS